MTDTERQSPRAAIRSWLVHHDDRSDHLETHARRSRRRGRHHRRDRAVEDRDQVPELTTNTTWEKGKERHRGALQNDRQVKAGHRFKTTNEVRCNPAKVQTYHSVEKDSSVKEDNYALADRLGLRAPFRTRGSECDGRETNAINSVRPAKRRKSVSTPSSTLQPAPTIDLTGRPIEEGLTTKNPKSSRQARKLSQVEDSSSSSSTEFKGALKSLEKPVKSFQKRPRHKTHEDRYKLKEDGGSRPKPNDRRTGLSNRKKRKPKEMTGAALLHEFTAKNVANERLTLKRTSTLGLFGRGRASSPVRRRGSLVPDLAFSELAFLNSKREKSDDIERPVAQKKNRRKLTPGDKDAEISKYFQATGDRKPDLARLSPPQKQRKMPSHSYHSGSVPLFVDMPDKPFLGFGNSGANSISPVKLVRELDARYVPPPSQRDTLSPSHSTSYFTWSQSAPRSIRPMPQKEHHAGSFNYLRSPCRRISVHSEGSEPGVQDRAQYEYRTVATGRAEIPDLSRTNDCQIRMKRLESAEPNTKPPDGDQTEHQPKESDKKCNTPDAEISPVKQRTLSGDRERSGSLIANRDDDEAATVNIGRGRHQEEFPGPLNIQHAFQNQQTLDPLDATLEALLEGFKTNHTSQNPEYVPPHRHDSDGITHQQGFKVQQSNTVTRDSPESRNTDPSKPAKMSTNTRDYTENPQMPSNSAFLDDRLPKKPQSSRSRGGILRHIAQNAQLNHPHNFTMIRPQSVEDNSTLSRNVSQGYHTMYEQQEERHADRRDMETAIPGRHAHFDVASQHSPSAAEFEIYDAGYNGENEGSPDDDRLWNDPNYGKEMIQSRDSGIRVGQGTSLEDATSLLAELENEYDLDTVSAEAGQYDTGRYPRSVSALHGNVHDECNTVYNSFNNRLQDDHLTPRHLPYQITSALGQTPRRVGRLQSAGAEEIIEPRGFWTPHKHY